jgi:dihydrofolate reductase
MIIGIVAIARNLAIGKDGKLPWRYSSDLKFFKRTTVGNTLVMGSNTWRAIGKPLPERLNVVLSRSREISLPLDVIQLSNKEQVTTLSEYLKGDLFIIGGAAVYQSFADTIEEWIVTDIPIDVPDADTFMPEDFLDGFEETAREQLEDGLVVRRLRRRGKTGV